MRLIQQREEIVVKEIKIPELAESITEGTIAEWLVKAGDKIEKGDPVVELETDKVNVEVNSDYAGVITEILSEEGDDVEVGDVIGKLDENGEAAGDSDAAKEEPEEGTKEEKKEDPTEEKKQEPAKQEEPSKDKSSDVVASPAARKRARELNI